MSNKDLVLTAIREKIDALTVLTIDLDWVNEIPYPVYLDLFNDICVWLPYDPEKIKYIAAMMATLGYFPAPVHASHKNAEYGVERQTFHSEDKQHRIHFSFSTDEVGATCKRQQIGTATVPVYEIVCKDADPL